MKNNHNNIDLNDATLVQNSAMGAFFIWYFCFQYQKYKNESPSLILSFLLFPLILHKSTSKIICTTNKSSGIHLLAGKLGKQREILLSIHTRAFQLRSLTLESIGIAEVSGLLKIEMETASLIAQNKENKLFLPLLSDDLNKLKTCCDKLAYWFSEESEQQIMRTLMVDF